VIEAQNYALAHVAVVDEQQDLLRHRATVVRNSRALLSLTFLGSAAAFAMCLCMVLLALSFVFPLHSIAIDRIATAFLWAVGAWMMAASNVFLWRQGRAMAQCSVLLDTYGAHFKLGAASNAKEVFMPWNEIEAVRYKRIPNAQKFTVLGADSSAVTFTSYSFYRPKKVAQMIADRAGLPLLRG